MKNIRQKSVSWLVWSAVCTTLVCTQWARAEETEELHKALPLNADGRLHLDNVNGSIRIEAWDKAVVQLDAVKKAKTKEQVDAVKIEIDSNPDRLTIHTKYPSTKNWFRNNNASVEYTLKVPKNAALDEISSVNGNVDVSGVTGKVHASTVNGAVNARGLAANTELSTVNGAVKAAFDSIDKVKSVSFSSVNGALDLQLPPNPNADISLSTVNGRISGDVTVKKNWPVGSEAKVQLGEGGTKVKGSTVNGGMKVTIAKS